mgnify:CR=1 FL=1
MKKSMFLLGMAAVALASCTNEEVMEVAQNRVIQFNAFVNNTTRAVSEKEGTLTNGEFYVFANYGYSADNSGTVVYNNELASKTAYWQTATYRFGAYYDGTTQNSNASFDANNGTLTITGYKPSDTNDLMAAISNEITCTDPSAQGAVVLTFKHLLSQVKFTFKTDDADAYTLAISDLTIENADISGNVIYNGTNITWNETTTGNYTYDDISDVADVNKQYTGESVEFIIPQDNTNNLKVTFTATISGPGIESKKKGTFSATLGYIKTTVEGTTDNTWTAGYRYNYTATINADDIDETLTEKIIEFTPTADKWLDADDTTYEPSTVAEP